MASSVGRTSGDQRSMSQLSLVRNSCTVSSASTVERRRLASINLTSRVARRRIEEIGMIIDLRVVDLGALHRRIVASSRDADRLAEQAPHRRSAIGFLCKQSHVAGLCRCRPQNTRGLRTTRHSQSHGLRTPSFGINIAPLTRKCRTPCRRHSRSGYRPAARHCNSAPSDTGHRPAASGNSRHRRSNNPGRTGSSSA